MDIDAMDRKIRELEAEVRELRAFKEWAEPILDNISDLFKAFADFKQSQRPDQDDDDGTEGEQLGAASDEEEVEEPVTTKLPIETLIPPAELPPMMPIGVPDPEVPPAVEGPLEPIDTTPISTEPVNDVADEEAPIAASQPTETTPAVVPLDLAPELPVASPTPVTEEVPLEVQTPVAATEPAIIDEEPAPAEEVPVHVEAAPELAPKPVEETVPASLDEVPAK